MLKKETGANINNIISHRSFLNKNLIMAHYLQIICFLTNLVKLYNFPRQHLQYFMAHYCATAQWLKITLLCRDFSFDMLRNE